MKLKITNDTKVFVVCPAYVKTGGTELLHQLVDGLRSLKINAKIYYVGVLEDNTQYMPNDFLKYNIDYVSTIDNSDNKSHNVLLTSETETKYIYKYKEMQHVIWWLSVDFYFIKITNTPNPVLRLLKTIKAYLQSGRRFHFGKDRNEITHLAQSYYAIEFLKGRNIDNIEYLSDYINDIYFEEKPSIKREDIIAYNPRKGINVTKQLIGTSDKKFIPLVDMTTAEIREMLYKSKVYIDFGNHPGKDRIPREAAMCGCCVIVGKNGAAKNEFDVSIPDGYKFDNESISEINDCIEDCLVNYDIRIRDFDTYRNMIKGEKDLFKRRVYEIWRYNG